MLVKVEEVGEVEVIEGAFAFAENVDGTDAVFLEGDEMPHCDEMDTCVKAIIENATQLHRLVTAQGSSASQARR